ncbi:MAG TPA: Maf family protein [Bacillota bacterium]|nr:Maf family protein [Bacillota bacterium]
MEKGKTDTSLLDKKTREIILASRSPRRRDIMQSLGLSFTVDVTDADETVPPGTPPDETVLILARRKAEAAAVKHPGTVVIGADTIVYLPGEGNDDGVILGKPADDNSAHKMLKALSGRTHIVYTGVAVAVADYDIGAGANGTIRTECECIKTEVKMKNLTDEEIDRYIKTGEPADKAGAYGVQERGGAFVEAVYGDYFAVVGLPKAALCRLLSHFGVDVI